jgi:DNA-binding CsgD family transcriptional regulator
MPPQNLSSPANLNVPEPSAPLTVEQLDLAESLLEFGGTVEFAASSPCLARVARVQRPASHHPIELTSRERSLFDMRHSRRMTCRQIADQLGLSINTVLTHFCNVNRKLKIIAAADLVRQRAAQSVQV